MILPVRTSRRLAAVGDFYDLWKLYKKINNANDENKNNRVRFMT